MSLLASFFRDAALVSFAFLACVAGGIALNAFRSEPLSYIPRTERLPVASPIPTVSLSEIMSADRKQHSVFIDAREADFFEDGHLPGAINLPVSRAVTGDFGGLPPNPAIPLIVYCSGGDCPDSHRVAAALLAKGFQNVSIFPGGWDEWSAAGSRP